MNKAEFENYIKGFVKDIKREFDKNFKNKLKGIIGDSMIRGNNPTLSNIVEDRFAQLLYTIYLEKNYLYLIDVSFSTKLHGESKSIRPDIVVIERKSNKIEAIFELKIDDARADDNWVEQSQAKLKRLKDISKNEDKEKNYIHYTTIKINNNGEPMKTRTGRFSNTIHNISCSQNAKLACITLCKENSRKKANSEVFRSSGEFAMYLSNKHFNNKNHTLQDLLDEKNLNTVQLYDLLIQMNL
ncbi:hypothetical protein [Neobacillus citreus]|uniref:Restriction endonuclease n=1 Tax=Neobacillus citreus TaxID=2833578 RepID=A0A942T9K3_9BACI|nr:hypothetical protein [Neobacillus citreus]MCH6265112.1 hypothetical protein [Neobacillus citreus]